MYHYPVSLEHTDDTHEYIVEFANMPGVFSVGDTEADALLNAADALETALFYLMQDRKPIPAASPLAGRHGVPLPVVTAAKVALHNTMLAEGMRKAELARRLNLAPTLVDRLLSIKHKTKIEQLETALALFGKHLVVGLS